MACSGLAVFHVLQKLHRKIPTDVSLLSLRNDRMLGTNSGTISAMAFSRRDIGIEAVRILTGGSRERQIRTLTYQFISRNSV